MVARFGAQLEKQGRNRSANCGGKRQMKVDVGMKVELECFVWEF